MNGVPATSVLTALSAMLAPRPTAPQPAAQSQATAATTSPQSRSTSLVANDTGQSERPRPPAEPRFEADAALPNDRPLPRGSLLNILA